MTPSLPTNAHAYTRTHTYTRTYTHPAAPTQPHYLQLRGPFTIFGEADLQAFCDCRMPKMYSELELLPNPRVPKVFGLKLMGVCPSGKRVRVQGMGVGFGKGLGFGLWVVAFGKHGYGRGCKECNMVLMCGVCVRARACTRALLQAGIQAARGDEMNQQEGNGNQKHDSSPADLDHFRRSPGT